MKNTTSRICQLCGAPVTGDVPCPACALAGAIVTLGLDQKPETYPARFSPFDLPSQFGDYLVNSEIAAGGMGMVYEAKDTRLERPVALKMLRQVFFASEQDRLRFQGEAELASQLDHPHIVPIHEVGEHEGQPYFTMKIIRGGNLADRLEKGAIPPRECAVLMAKIAQAVHHAHQHGIMHRDLKPANILLDETGEPWLTDFGIAKALDVESGLTLTQTLLGTPDYMSPEQAAGRKGEISTATDVWSLGVILYQMLTGRLPFHGDSNSEVFRLVAEREPLAPRTILPRSDRDLETLCLRCLEKDPSRRLSGAAELAEELERWLQGKPIRARRISGLERFGKWTRRHPYRALGIAAFFVVVMGAVLAVTWQWRLALESEKRALASADIEKRTAYSATLTSALAAREKHDFGTARRLLGGIPLEMRGFDWRLLSGLCRGDERNLFRVGEESGDEPQCITMMPGREQLAILSADGRLHLRDARGGEVRPPRLLPPMLEEGEGALRYYGLTFSPDRQRLAYANGNILQVLDAETLDLLHETTSVSPQFAWLDDHRLLYGFNGSMTAPPWPEAGAWILDFENVRSAGEKIPTTPLRSMCAPLAVSPDRRFFALHRVNTHPASWTRTLHVYRSDGDHNETPEPVYSMPGNEYPGELAISQSGRYLAFSAGSGLKRSARVLDLSSGTQLFDEEFRFTIRSLAIDPREHRLGLVGDDGVVRLYDFTRGNPALSGLNTYDDEVPPVHCQQIRGRGAHAPPAAFATRSAQDGRARFFLGHEQSVGDLVFGGHGSFVTAGSDGAVRQWVDLIPRPSIRIGYQHKLYNMRHPAASVDGRYVLSYASSDSQLCDVAASRLENKNVILGTSSRQSPLAVFSDGAPVTFDHETGELVVWKLAHGQLGEAFRLPTSAPGGHDARSRRGVLSRDEKKMAGSLAGKLYSVDFEQRKISWGTKPGNRLTVHANHDLSPDGKWIASSDFGSRITIHPFLNPDEIVTRLGGADRGYDTAVAFSRDGRRLHGGNEDGRIRVWDTATWQELPELGWLAHRSTVTALAVSHEGKLIATSGGDSLKLFPCDPEPGESYRRERLSFSLDQPANWIQFARGEDGRDRALLYNVPGRSIEIWESAVGTLPESQEPPLDEAALPIALVNHGAVLLPGGKALIAGGVSWSKAARSECYLFDSSRSRVSETGAMREPRATQPAMIWLPEGRALVAGGSGRDGMTLASCELYDPEEERWAPTGALTSPRAAGELILLSTGKVLIVGGTNANGACSACELYDPQTRKWTPTGSLAIERGGTAYVQLANGKVLAVGGHRKFREYPAAEIYDPETGVWIQAGSPLTNRSHSSAVTLESGEVLIVGGMDDRKLLLTDCELYEPATGSWREAPSLPAGRAVFGLTGQFTTLLPNGKALVAGEATGTGVRIRHEIAACHLYDPETDRWSDSPDLATPRLLHRALLLANGNVLLIGGSTEQGPTRSIEVYDPGQ